MTAVAIAVERTIDGGERAVGLTGAPVAPPVVDEGAVVALLAEAVALGVEGCRELARRLTEWALLQEKDADLELTPLKARDELFTWSIREVAVALGQVPSTTDYADEYRRRRKRGDTALASVSAILKHFRHWPDAIAAAGLAATPPARAIRRLRSLKRPRGERYSDPRLARNLRRCAREIGRIPMVRDYSVWRETKLDGRPGARRLPPNIPHYRTYYNRFGSWDEALRQAGLDGDRATRTLISDEELVS